VAKKNSPVERRGFRPVKGLGQHFLKDAGIAEKIVSRAGIAESDLVLEIGPGLGALTLPLSRLAGRVLAVEKDARLLALLANKIAERGIQNVTLVHGDFLKIDLQKVLGPFERKAEVVGNIPYGISSPILEKLTRNKEWTSRALLMFQLEFAARLTASPGSKAYGAMTVLTRYEAEVRPVLEVSRTAFHPQPKVDSMVVQIDFGSPYPTRAVDEVQFKRVVKSAFAYRRKTVLNSFKRSFARSDAQDILAALRTCALDGRSRAETLGIEDFLCLAASLTK